MGPLLAWLRRRPFTRRTPAQRLGRRGERIALRALGRAGYRVLGRNLRTPAGEVDILAWERGGLVLVEVKTSRTLSGEALARRLGWRQRRRLGAAGRWLTTRPGPVRIGFRLDLVTVTFDGRRSLVTIRRDIAGA